MAAGSPAVKVTGDKEFRKALGHMEKDVKSMEAVHEKAGEKVLRAARSRAPARRGRLRRSLDVRAEKGRAIVASDLVYAKVIHTGWPRHHIRPHPFLLEALEESGDEVRGVYSGHVGKLVKRVDRETK